jgi:acetate kinase
MFVARIVKYAGSYFTELGGADAIIFTGGIGEHSSYVRKLILDKLQCIGINLDDTLNEKFRGIPGIISTPASKWKAIVMPTNEELMIARETLSVITHENHNIIAQ